MDAFEIWLHELGTAVAMTSISVWIQGQPSYFFATLETLHLLGMVLVLGAIATFDLTVLGFAKPIRPAAMHWLIPWGVAGFLVTLITGAIFVIGHPHQYFFDPAFRVKVVLLLLAGLNVLAFYSTAFDELRVVPGGGRAPARSRVITAISLAAWTGVLVCGALVSAQFFG